MSDVATGLPTDELYRTLNMGVGMVVVVSAARVAELQSTIPEPSWVIGSIIPGNKRVQLR